MKKPRITLLVCASFFFLGVGVFCAKAGNRARMLNCDIERIVSVYVDGQSVGGGVVLSDGTTFVPLRSVSEALGAKVDYDAATGRVNVSRSDIPSSNIVSLASTRNLWCPIAGSNGHMRFKDAMVKDKMFSAEVAVDRGLFTRTNKPIEVTLIVILYDASGQPVVRSTVSLYRVSCDGGDYLMQGPVVSDDVQSCEIKYQGGWVPTK